MSADPDVVGKAFALLEQHADILSMADEMHRHFLGHGLDALPRETVPGTVLRWLNCACDLELWQEAFAGRRAPLDLDRALDLVARLEEIGVEPLGETRCFACDFRKRCR